MADVNWKRIAFWATLFFVFYTAPTEGQNEITLTIYPRVALTSEFKRATIRVSWHIQRHPDNRRWAFTYDSDMGDVGSSQGEMQGDNSPTVFPLCTRDNDRPCFREVSQGTYWFIACVYRVTNNKVVKFCDQQTMEVHGE